MQTKREFCILDEERLNMIYEVLVLFPMAADVCNEPAKALGLRQRSQDAQERYRMFALGFGAVIKLPRCRSMGIGD